MYNKCDENYHLSNKKALYYNMKNFCQVFNLNLNDYLPQTYHIKSAGDQAFKQF